MSWDRSGKNQARNVICKFRKKYKSILDLPGNQSLSLRQLTQNGSVDRDTLCIVVERNKNIANKLKKLESQYNCVVFNKDLTKLELPFALDFYNFDFCGTPSEELMGWIQNTPFKRNSYLFFTFSAIWRNCPFLKKYASTPKWQNRVMLWENLNPTEVSVWFRSEGLLKQVFIGWEFILESLAKHNPKPIVNFSYCDTSPMNLFGVKL